MESGVPNVPVPVIDWFGEPIKQSVMSVFSDLNSATEALDIFKKYRNRHFESLKQSISNIKILGMSTPIPLLSIYTPSYVSTTIHSRLYEKEWHRAAIGDGEAITIPRKMGALKSRADDYIESHDRVIILGTIGSGKTTLLRYLGLAYSSKEVFELSNLKTSKFPFYVPMLAYSQFQKSIKLSLYDYIVYDLEAKTDKYAKNFVRRILEKGAGVILLDALDEVPLIYRDDVIKDINRISTEFPKCKLVLSCRTADYKGNFESFFEVEMARLSQTAVHKIIRAWFKDDTIKSANLIKLLRDDRGVQSLAETPLLLSLLCIQFSYDLTLPKRKTELYRRCVDALLRHWDTSRGFKRDTYYSSLTDDRKESIFERIAGKYTLDENKYIFPQSELIKEIGKCCELYGIPEKEGEAVLNEIEKNHGILEKLSAESYVFCHPSFQEYFSAKYILSRRNEYDIIKRNFEKIEWRNIIEFIVSMHPDPHNIFKYIKEHSDMAKYQNYPAMARRTRNLWLLYRCMNTGSPIGPSFRRELYKHIFDSQISMASIYENGGVIPIAVLMPDGVRHTYVYYSKRNTLYTALQPLRIFANEILIAPSTEYAQIVIEGLDRLEMPSTQKERLSFLTTGLCLLVPLAVIRPNEILKWIEKIKNTDAMDILHKITDETKKVLYEHYLKV